MIKTSNMRYVVIFGLNCSMGLIIINVHILPYFLLNKIWLYFDTVVGGSTSHVFKFIQIGPYHIVQRTYEL